MKRVVTEAGGNKVPEFHTRWHFQDAALRSVLSEIGHEFSEGWPLGGLYADLLSLRLASVLLARHAASPVPPTAMRGGLSSRSLRMCLEFVTDNLHRQIRLADVARVADLSQFHFARLFRETTGQTPYQYHLQQRICRAKYLLRTTSSSIEEIGATVGFASLASFSRSFTSQEGISPRSWRTQI